MKNIPFELKALPQWVCRKGKIPYTPKTGNKAKAGVPETWGSFEEAVNAKGYDGIGFEFADGGHYIGVDLDSVRDPISCQVDPVAEDIIRKLDSYTEISPSGSGFHVIVKGTLDLSPWKNKALLCDIDSKPGAKTPEIEVYDKKRYFTMTGNVYKSYNVINVREAELKCILDHYGKKRSSVKINTPAELTYSQDSSISQTDMDYLNIGLNKDKILQSYWDGERKFNDESRNDLAFMNKLAYWCNCNLDLMLQAFKESPYCNLKDQYHARKVLEREDYLPNTAKQAITNCNETALSSHDKWSRELVKNDYGIPHKPQNELITISASELLNEDIPPLQFVVEEFLAPGLVVLASPPKYGKSWFVLDLCISVADGKPFLNYNTNKGSCLYLALEDSERRLQDRMKKLLQGEKAPNNFHFAVTASLLDDGLLNQLNSFLQNYPDTKLIVIDTLQKIRKPGNGKDVYGKDYADMGKIKHFADKFGICILLVHHLRKMQSYGDPFDRISGTAGISGAADTNIVMGREKRSDKTTTLSLTSRDIGEHELVIRFDEISFRWINCGSAERYQTEKAILKFHSDPLVKTIQQLLKESDTHSWKGRMTNLIDEGSRFGYVITESPAELNKHLKGIESLLKTQCGIIHDSISNGSASKIHNFEYCGIKGI